MLPPSVLGAKQLQPVPGGRSYRREVFQEARLSQMRRMMPNLRGCSINTSKAGDGKNKICHLIQIMLHPNKC